MKAMVNPNNRDLFTLRQITNIPRVLCDSEMPLNSFQPDSLRSWLC